MYIPKYFILQEWLPRKFYVANINKYGSKLWLMFDDRMLWTADKLRERYGRTTINNWWWGGKNQYRGWRPFDCEVGAEISQHKFGRAGDSLFSLPAEEIRQDILNNESDDIFKHISVIEKDVGWLHCDCRNTRNKDGISLI